MAEKPSESAADPGSEALPHSWVWIGLGFAGCGLAAVLCAVVIRQYLPTRPENLCDYTATLAGIFEQSLLDNRVLEADIERGAPELRSHDDAHWNAFEFNVAVPASIDIEGLIEVVARHMLYYNVSTSKATSAEAPNEWVLALGPYEFARVRVQQEVRRADLTAETGAIVKKCVSVLEDVGIPAGNITRVGPELKGDDRASWSFTRLETELPASCTVFGLESAFRDELDAHDVRIVSRVRIDGTAVVTVSWQGVDCIEIVLGQARGEPDTDGPPPIQLAILPRLKDPLAQAETTAAPETPPNDSQTGTAPDTVPQTVSPAQERPSAGAVPSTEIPKVAIIIDDNGYGGEATERILALNTALTLSVLPNTPYATQTADRARELGFEVMLHMPMEKADVAGQVGIGMSRDQMRRLIDDALSQVPGAAGVNNHMGSVFTANETAVTTFMDAIKDTRLFFVDSRTTAQTKALEAAQKAGITAASRNVFLDNVKEPAYIRDQLNKLVALAKEQGRAIGIGHCKTVTAEALAEVLPGLEDQGVRLAHVSEVVE